MRSVPRLTNGCSCCGRMFNPRHERGRAWTCGQFNIDMRDLDGICGACLSGCISSYWPKGTLQIGDIPQPVSSEELTLWTIRRMRALENRQERGVSVHTCEAIRSNHWEQCSNISTKFIAGHHYCSRHSALLEMGKKPKLSDSPRIRCFVVSDNLECAVQQVKAAWGRTKENI